MTLTNGTTEIFLVRHGETDWNREKRTQGNMDMPLNDLGRAQAKRLVAALQAHHRQRAFDALVSSDLTRAVATIEPTVNALGLALSVDAGWRERHFGVLEGLTQDQMQAQQPQAYAGWLAADPQYQIPQGESLQQLIDRVGNRLTLLTQSHQGQRVLVMTHGGVIDAAARYMGFTPAIGARGYVIANTCICHISFEQQQWVKHFWVQANHLESEAK
jgi:2,3-bisphosphoglycerate-dependent phosphoglycerate mutase